MRVLRWVLLALYVALIAGLGALEIRAELSVPILATVLVVSLAIFVLGAGRKGLCRPIRSPRRVLPVAVAAFMVSVLVAGLTLAAVELFEAQAQDDAAAVAFFWGFLLLNWVFWGVLLYVYTRKLERYQVIFRLATFVFAGSLAELLAALPSHVLVTRRGGCFAGWYTGLGMIAGLCVMLWSFGPGILLLFLKEAYHGEKPSGQSRPSVGAPRRRFQFRLRSMLLVTLALSVVLGLLKTSWGQWPAAGLAAFLVVLLTTQWFMRQSRLPLVAALGIIALLVWVSWKEPEAICLSAVVAVVLVLQFLALGLSRDSSDQGP